MALNQVGIDKNSKQYIRWQPLHEIPSPHTNSIVLKKFDDWWMNQIIISYNKSYEYTRKDIVTLLCNKDGGAHVDKALPADYY